MEQIKLDGKEVTVEELNEAKKQPGVKIVLVEGTTNEYKTLHLLNG